MPPLVSEVRQLAANIPDYVARLRTQGGWLGDLARKFNFTQRLQDLTDRITQPQFCYAHEYKKGDLLIIDDRASLHKAGFDYDHSQHRRLYRMLVRGDRPR